MSQRGLAWGVYLITFLSGAVVMAFEILGSRVLAPFFGNSIFVWGNLISVFMLGLAADYYLGGLLSSRGCSFQGLALLLFAPAVLISLFPPYAWPICEWLFDKSLGQRLGPLMASLFLFTLPTLFLGTIDTSFFLILWLGTKRLQARAPWSKLSRAMFRQSRPWGPLRVSVMAWAYWRTR